MSVLPDPYLTVAELAVWLGLTEQRPTRTSSCRRVPPPICCSRRTTSPVSEAWAPLVSREYRSP